MPLERQGITEMGMAISNYDGERSKVLVLLQGMQVRLVNEEGKVIKDESRRIQVQGPNVLRNIGKQSNKRLFC